jgi:hypothetical protein
MKFAELIPSLQIAIGPVILISGIGLLLLSMTNRFGRVVDRSRSLAEALRHAGPAEHPRLSSQLRILVARARLIRLSITLATVSLLLAAILIIVLFLGALFQIEAVLGIVVIFIGCLASLIGSLIVFLRDIYVSLKALELEIVSADRQAR